MLLPKCCHLGLRLLPCRPPECFQAAVQLGVLGGRLRLRIMVALVRLELYLPLCKWAQTSEVWSVRRQCGHGDTAERMGCQAWRGAFARDVLFSSSLS
jgi:hypothetical protein